jgi:hypothetical protein
MYCGNNDEYPEIDLATDDIESRIYLGFGAMTFDNLWKSLLSVFMIINATWFQ